ncbi:conserved hypothetical protein [Xenorhabdus innexi]|uniref:Transposase n=1 Tax=Xenorhabdus innexi TaxID=290109 RepID=A0A1N6N215_9GAMM|nr:transposase [Xenorhabdus innexi]SIP75107.1 conserved hypothetical protein [Xenorhabdus innexi]
MFLTDAEQWAKDTFSQADLGEHRRTKRLVKFTSSLANHIGQSIVQSLKTPADIEAAYRFIRNGNIDAGSIAEAGFAATAEQDKSYNCLLALEDIAESQHYGIMSVTDNNKAELRWVTVWIFEKEYWHTKTNMR